MIHLSGYAELFFLVSGLIDNCEDTTFGDLIDLFGAFLEINGRLDTFSPFV